MRDDRLYRELADATRQLTDRMTELTALTRGNHLNNILWSGTVTIPANGFHTFNFHVPMASVAVQASITAGLVTVVSDPPANPVPVDGPGVYTVGPDAFLCIPMTGRTLTIYGTVGDRVLVAVSSKPWPPAGA
jgi:hypothetical protein